LRLSREYLETIRISGNQNEYDCVVHDFAYTVERAIDINHISEKAINAAHKDGASFDETAPYSVIQIKLLDEICKSILFDKTGEVQAHVKSLTESDAIPKEKRAWMTRYVFTD